LDPSIKSSRTTNSEQQYSTWVFPLTTQSKMSSDHRTKLPPVRQRPIASDSFLSQFTTQFTTQQFTIRYARRIAFPHPLVLGPVGNRTIPSSPFQPVPLLQLIFLPLHHLYHQDCPLPLRHSLYAKMIVSTYHAYS